MGTQYNTQVIKPNPLYSNDQKKQTRLNEMHLRGYCVMYKTNDPKMARYVITDKGVEQWTKELRK